jgi:hypothetical protein
MGQTFTSANNRRRLDHHCVFAGEKSSRVPPQVYGFFWLFAQPVRAEDTEPLLPAD